MEGVRRDVSKRKKKMNRFTDVFDPIEDQNFRGRVVNTYVES